MMTTILAAVAIGGIVSSIRTAIVAQRYFYRALAAEQKRDAAIAEAAKAMTQSSDALDKLGKAMNERARLLEQLRQMSER